jgi:hypothetical protein
MHSTGVLIRLAALLLCIFAISTASISAQGSDLAGHPLVGSWVLDSDVADPENPDSMVVFTSDGVFLETDPDGTTGVGVWESTGDTTGQVTFWYVSMDGVLVVRAGIEVSADGMIFTADYTVEFVDPAGESMGEYGPGQAEATRAEVEPMGTPAGTLEDLFEGFEEPAATPAN